MVEPPVYVRGTRIEPLGKHHNRDQFQCPDPELTRWFQQQAGQFHRRGNARVWVWVHEDQPETVLGYFTLSSSEIVKQAIPGPVRELMRVPAALIGKLARADSAPKGAGTYLLRSAMQVAFQASDLLGLRYVVLDAVNERVARWYQDQGFQRAVVPEGESGPTIRMLMPLDLARRSE